MTCAKCNHGFCWRCLKSWKPSHKDYYNCSAMVRGWAPGRAEAHEQLVGGSLRGPVQRGCVEQPNSCGNSGEKAEATWAYRCWEACPARSVHRDQRPQSGASHPQVAARGPRRAGLPGAARQSGKEQGLSQSPVPPLSVGLWVSLLVLSILISDGLIPRPTSQSSEG